MNLSFELYPPKIWDQTIQEKYHSLINTLLQYNPKFISCTYGANGGTRITSLKILKMIRQLGGEALAHCTIANQSWNDVEKFVEQLRDIGINKILCLRGDTNSQEKQYASDLMKFIGNKYGNEFEIFGAWYPEKHQENKQLSMEVEIEKNFKNKTKNGCKKFISQCFFDNQEFLSVTKKINNSYQGIDLYAGIFPLLKTKQLENIQKLSGCSIPNSVTEFFKTNSEQPEAIYEFGIKNTIKQVQDLLKHDFTNIHIFTMNDEQSIVEIMKEFKNV